MFWNHPDLQRCMCWDSNTNDWCEGYWEQCQSYWESVYGSVAPAVVAAVIVAIFVAVYYVLRILSCMRCVTCLLMRKNSNGGVKIETVTTYRRIIMVLLVAMTASAIVCTAFRAGDISSGMHDINNSLTSMRQTMTTAGQVYEDSSMDMAAVLNAPYQIQQMIMDQASHVTKWGHDMSDIQSNVINNTWTVDVFMFLPVIFTVVLLILSLLQVRRIVPEIMVFIMVLVAGGVYILQASFGGLAEVSSDVCDDYIPMTQAAVKILHSNLKCDATGSAMGRMFQTTNDLTDLYVQQTCDSIVPPVVCSEYFTCNPCSSLTTISTMILNGSSINSNIDKGNCTGNCSIYRCATECPMGSDVQIAAKEFALKDEQVLAWKTGIIASVYPLASCAIFDAEIAVQGRNICGTFKSKLRPYSNSSAFMCFFATFMVIFYGLLNCIYAESHEARLMSVVTTGQPDVVGVAIDTQELLPNKPATSYGTNNTTSYGTAIPATTASMSIQEPAQEFVFDPVDKPTHTESS